MTSPAPDPAPERAVAAELKATEPAPEPDLAAMQQDFEQALLGGER